jgi:hypothetical protein
VPEQRLGLWVQGAHRAVLASLMTLERLAAWHDRSRAETADLQGRTPARLIEALAAQLMLGAAQAQAETGANRAAVQRNLDLLMARGLVHEAPGRDGSAYGQRSFDAIQRRAALALPPYGPHAAIGATFPASWTQAPIHDLRLA